MKLVTFSGPPASGKTSVILKLRETLDQVGPGPAGVVKFDCLSSHDAERYRAEGIPVQAGVSGAVCPDHFFASNIGACVRWGERHGLGVLVSESAGLCNRCSPHLRGVAAVCVIDILSGIDAPAKVGPMLRLADFVAITKSDLVSQAEREVFALHVRKANPRARVFFANGLTGQGCQALGDALAAALATQSEHVERLRFSTPAAVCSYCFGETQIGDKFATGNIKYMTFDDEKGEPAAFEKGEAAAEKTCAPEPATLTASPSSPASPASAADEIDLLEAPFAEVVARYPFAGAFFPESHLETPAAGQSVASFVSSLDEFALADCGMDAPQIREAFVSYIRLMESLGSRERFRVESLEIAGGHDKAGRPEGFSLTVRPGDVVCVVGPTGSGKSRLLEDVEYLAQGDTPTGRRVLVNGSAPDASVRQDVENRIVAQLSQGMVFVMDLPARDFLRLHAESRMLPSDSIDALVDRAIACANDLAGEPFAPETPLTVLSGGQSRALMIADIAFISSSPIVLVDEIENAGVDRTRALDLLVRNDKIVFVVTHDPLIALMGTKRVVIGGGGVRAVIEPSERERRNADPLRRIDERLMALRSMVRSGEQIDFDMEAYLFGGAGGAGGSGDSGGVCDPRGPTRPGGGLP